MEPKVQCSKRIWDGRGFSHACHKKPKVQINGVWYCHIHDPEAVKRRKEKWEAKMEAQSKADHERWERQAYDRKAGDACRALGIVDPETELANFVRKEAGNV